MNQHGRINARFAWGGSLARALRLRFREERVPQMAASLAFTTLLALVPMVTLALALMSAFPVFADLGDKVRLFLQQNLLPDAAGRIVTAYTLQFSQKAGRLTALGTGALLAAAVLLMLTIDRAFNAIWRVPRQRPILQRILLYWMMLTLGPLVAGASLALTSYAVSMSLGLIDEPPWVRDLLMKALSAALIAAFLGLLYHAIPNRPIRYRHALTGGIAAALALTLLQRLFEEYLSHFPTYTVVYGAFAVVPIFLLWIYLCWTVVLVGALLAAVLPDFRHVRPRGGEPAGSAYAYALSALQHLGEAHATGRRTGLTRLAAALRLPLAETETLLEKLRALGWAARSEDGRWLLGRDLMQLKLAEVRCQFLFSPQLAGMARDGREAARIARLAAPTAAEALSVADWLAQECDAGAAGDATANISSAAVSSSV